MSNSWLEDSPVSIRLKISALWTAVLFCFVYADFFGLFLPGRLITMNAGIMAPLGVATPLVLLSISAMMAIPSALIAISLLLPGAMCRLVSIIFGGLYTIIMILTSIGSPAFYILFAAVEIGMLIAIITLAVHWPKII